MAAVVSWGGFGVFFVLRGLVIAALILNFNHITPVAKGGSFFERFYRWARASETPMRMKSAPKIRSWSFMNLGLETWGRARWAMAA